MPAGRPLAEIAPEPPVTVTGVFPVEPTAIVAAEGVTVRDGRAAAVTETEIGVEAEVLPSASVAMTEIVPVSAVAAPTLTVPVALSVTSDGGDGAVVSTVK